MSEKKKSDNITRRSFIAKTSAVAAFTIVPRHVLGGPGQTPPSEKLNLAVIGIGGKGKTDANECSHENIYALCDVDFSVKKAPEVVNAFPKAKKYTDYRVMLDKEKSIDGVVIATPDHQHAPIAIHAMKMGKHCYCQKPLTHTVEEALLMAKVAREEKVATQMGNQGQASEETRRIQELMIDGAIGNVSEVHLWTNRPIWPQGIDRPKEKQKPSADLDWDLWLGPAPVRPYNQAYHPFAWRGWWDFGCGALGDMGCHIFDPVFRALKLGYPRSVQAVSTPVNKETFPSGSMVTYEFPKRGKLPPVKITWYDGGLKPQRPDELEDGRQMGNGGSLYIGDKGKILDGYIIPHKKMTKYGQVPKVLTRSPGHYIEWTNACKGGEPGGSNFDFASMVTATVLMGNVAIRPDMKNIVSRQKLLWDAKKKQFSNSPEANQFLTKEYRKGWEIKA
jgi:predicted dehydrogenase